MDAFFARNRLSAYLDGELTSAEARDVEAALAREPELREELDAMRAAIELLRDGGMVEPPEGFADRLALRLQEESMPVGWRRWMRQIRPEGAMLAAAALLVVIYVGNHDSLPDLELPDDAGLVAARSFDKGVEEDETTSATGPGGVTEPGGAAPVSQGEETAVAKAGAASTSPEAPTAGYGKQADGVLGNEPKQAVDLAMKKGSPKPTVRGKPSGQEVEPWRASWEKEVSQGNGVEPELNTGGFSAPVGKTTAGNTATSNTATVQWSSPPPFRYRVTAGSDMAMKQLAAIAAELGGSVQDSRGRPLAAYQLDEGEARSIRVSVPAHNAARLAERLRELGVVETIKEPGNLLADPNTEIGVQIELRN
jgi:hypothetical protein